jgi:hypothetical protein
MTNREERRRDSGARYDGLSRWYDDYLKRPLYAEVPRYLLQVVGH